MTDQRTLFVTFDSDEWTQDQLRDASDALQDILPEDVEAIIVPDSIDFLSHEEVEDYIEELVAALEDNAN